MAGSEAPPPRLPALEGISLVLIETDAVGQHWRAWGARLRRRAENTPRPPAVVSMSAGALAGEYVPGDGLTSAAWSAVSWSIGYADSMPLTLPFDLADFQAAIYACAAGLAALVADPAEERLRSVEVAERDVLAYYVGMITANFLPYERPWTRDGARPPGSAGVYPASIFPCRDGHVALMCRSQREWDALLVAMGSPAWAADPRFGDPRIVARLYADEADSHLEPWVRDKTTTELVALAASHGLALAPIRSVREALDEPQFAHRGFLSEHQVDGMQLRAAGVPWRLLEVASGAEPVRQWPVHAESTAPTRLLEGLRVLDLSWVWSGPLTTSVLADLGAEVLKIEHGDHMDTGRLRGKARRGGVEVDGPHHEATPYFNQMNHGKKSITANLKDPRARELILEIAAQCDVVVENMRSGVLDSLGLGYAAFAASNPAIVMLSMSMAGQSGPLRSMKGYAGIMAAMSGLESLIGYDSEHIVGSLSAAIGDPNAAGHALTVLMAALHRRKKTGRGVWIDLSQIEALLSVLPVPIILSQVCEDVRPPANTHPSFAPHGHFSCHGEDQWIAISVRSDRQWESLAALADAGQPGKLSRRRWQSAGGRLSDRARLEQAVSEWTRGQDRDSLTDRLLGIGVAAAPLASFEQMSVSEWKKERELTVVVDHRYLGPTEVFVVPWKFGGQSVGQPLPAPLLGADTTEVLGLLLGLDGGAVSELRQVGVLR
jgi:crotonobetainyl-CoA:carnitine CoA-transferase CaiB-like acyl-CoA transferase